MGKCGLDLINRQEISEAIRGEKNIHYSRNSQCSVMSWRSCDLIRLLQPRISGLEKHSGGMLAAAAASPQLAGTSPAGGQGGERGNVCQPWEPGGPRWGGGCLLSPQMCLVIERPENKGLQTPPKGRGATQKRVLTRTRPSWHPDLRLQPPEL